MRHADARHSMRTPVIVGGVFGFVYVMANVTLLPSEAAQALRVIAIVGFVGNGRAPDIPFAEMETKCLLSRGAC